jgi:tetratricopeptide (TPR) repeat protein
MTIRATMVLGLVCAVGATGCTSPEYRTQAVVAEPGAISQAQILDAYAQSYKLETDKQFDASEQSIRPMADRGDEYALLRQAWLAYQAGNYKLSEARYSAIVGRNPSLVEARLGLMLPLMAQSRWKDAAAQAREVLAQNPGQYIAHVRLLRCEEAMKQWDVVEAHADQMAALYLSDSDILIAKARARAARRQVAAARDAYATVLTRTPDNEEAQLYLRAHP